MRGYIYEPRVDGHSLLRRRCAPMFRALVICSAFVVVACGSPSAGGPCNTSGVLCAASTTALECQLGKWVALPCRGPMGCQRMSNTVLCDMSLDLEGDKCASTAVGSGLCTQDMTATLECRNDPASGTNSLVKTNTCRTCIKQTNSSTGKEEIICQP